MNIADRILEQRKLKGLSQEELADKIGVSRQAVSKWESEQAMPDIDKIILMSDYFGVTTDFLIKGIEPIKDSQKERSLDARAFTVICTALNVVALIVLVFTRFLSTLNFYSFAFVLPSVVLITSLAIFIVGSNYLSFKKSQKKAKKLYYTINIWLYSYFIALGIYVSNMSFVTYNGIVKPDVYPMVIIPSFVEPVDKRENDSSFIYDEYLSEVDKVNQEVIIFYASIIAVSFVFDIVINHKTIKDKLVNRSS